MPFLRSFACPRWPPALLVALGATAIVAAVRLLLVARYGTSNPFMDQWDAEIQGLYPRYLLGQLHFADFFQPHNEHRIALTRLISLGLFELNERQFDAKMQMFFNISIYLAFAGVLMSTVIRFVPGRCGFLFVAVALLAMCLPLGWENLVAGFQSQFYLLIVFAVVLIHIAVTSRIGPKTASAALCIAVLANFALASGALASFVAAAVLVLRALHAPGQRKRMLALATALAVVFVLALTTLPQPPHHAPLHAQTPFEFARACAVALSWPFRASPVPAMLVYMPTAFAVVSLLRRLAGQQSLQRGSLYLLALSAWTLVQAAALAYSRGHVMFDVSSRYVDLFSIGLLANIALALRMARRNRNSRFTATAAFVYTLTMTFGLLSLVPQSLRMMQERHEYGLHLNQSIRNYLADGDRARLAASHHGPLAYPEPARLANLLDDPIITGFMPADVARPAAVVWESCQGFEAPTPLPLPSARISQAAGNGKCLSRPFQLMRSYVLGDVAGVKEPGKTGSYSLIAADGHRRGFDAIGSSAESWRPALARAGAGEYRLLALDSRPDASLGFTLPREAGRLTAASHALVRRDWKYASILAVLGLALLSIAAQRAYPHTRPPFLRGRRRD